jgi:uncharacterized cupredoxin-like copper-binding protein
VGFNAPGDKNAKDGSFNMNAMKNALDDVEGAKGNVVPITPNKEKSS